MVGKIHKKKISEYTEAAENEDNRSEKGDDGDETMDNIEAIGSGSESENGDIAINDNRSTPSMIGHDEETGADDDIEQSGHHDEDYKSYVDLGDEDEDDDEDKGKKAKKRKSSGKKGDDSDDEALNGTPKKKGRKAGGGGGKGKAKAGKAKAKKAVAVDDDEDDDEEGEEEYEVKDIVGHKMERGVSYFLIRWKGYTKDDDTWEAEETLNCPEIISKYKKKQVTTTPKKGSPPKKGAKKPAAKVKKEEPEKEWEVEKIVDYAEEKKGRVFRIRWKGFGPKSDTWEPEANLNCHDKIQQFLSKMKSQENLSFKELREEPKKTKRLVNETAPRTNINNPIGRKSKRSTTKKSDDEDDGTFEDDPTTALGTGSPPTKKSFNEFERLCKSISHTVSKINTTIDEPHQDNVDLQFLKMMLSLMRDVPLTLKNKFQSDMFAEIYRLRCLSFNNVIVKEYNENRSSPANRPSVGNRAILPAISAQATPKSNSKSTSKSKNLPKRKRY